DWQNAIPVGGLSVTEAQQLLLHKLNLQDNVDEDLNRYANIITKNINFIPSKIVQFAEKLSSKANNNEELIEKVKKKALNILIKALKENDKATFTYFLENDKKL